jgi:hypothetical protein
MAKLSKSEYFQNLKKAVDQKPIANKYLLPNHRNRGWNESTDFKGNVTA